MKEAQPKGLHWLSIVECGERFSFYGMRAILVLFMSLYLMMDMPLIGKIYGIFIGTVYLVPVFGGYIADRYWGKDKTIIVGSIIMTIGLFLLTTVHWTKSIISLYISLAVILIGCGLFKSNMTTAVGDLYKDKNDPRRDGGFTIFYMYINIGALLAGLCGLLGEKIAWGYGFLAAAIIMLLSLILYIVKRKDFLPECSFHPASSKMTKTGEVRVNEKLTSEDIQRIIVIFIMAVFSISFWFAFEQSGSSMNLFAFHSINRTIFGWEVPATLFQSVNPLFVIILAPLFSKMWVKMSGMGNEPSTPMKFVWGLILLGLGFVVLAYASKFEFAGKVTMWWLVLAILLHTLGELCLSPVGLSLVTKLSPARLVSFFMGVWFASMWVSNTLSGFFAGSYVAEDIGSHFTFFMTCAYPAFISAAILLILIRFIRRKMHGIH